MNGEKLSVIDQRIRGGADKNSATVIYHRGNVRESLGEDPLIIRSVLVKFTDTEKGVDVEVRRLTDVDPVYTGINGLNKFIEDEKIYKALK